MQGGVILPHQPTLQPHLCYSKGSPQAPPPQQPHFCYHHGPTSATVLVPCHPTPRHSTAHLRQRAATQLPQSQPPSCGPTHATAQLPHPPGKPLLQHCHLATPPPVTSPWSHHSTPCHHPVTPLLPQHSSPTPPCNHPVALPVPQLFCPYF